MTQSAWNLLTGDRERDRRNVQILMESVEELYGPRPLAELLSHAVDRAIRVTGAQRGILLLADERGTLAVRLARSSKGVDLPLSERYSSTVVAAVWKNGTPHLTADAEAGGGAPLGQSVVAMRLLSIMAVPLPVKGRSLGVLYVDSTMSAKEFTQADFSVFTALGGIVALAVENARLLEAEVERQRRLLEEQAERQRLQREMELARTIQQGLLPRDIRPPAGFDLAAEGRPCEDTSGDYYDAIPLADGRMALVVGDVSGHGLGPALFMASTRAQVHALLSLDPDPLAVMRALNRFLERDLRPGSFITLWMGVLDPAARTLSYVSAGHNPPLLVRGAEIRPLPRTGVPLGILGGAEYTQAGPIAVERGDTLVLYTDGVYEAQGPDGQMWEEERFHASVTKHARGAREAAPVLRGVLDDLDSFVKGRPFADDITCLVLKVL
jgi:serine phosphatase RsbU (regulator of sigma subunit)